MVQRRPVALSLSFPFAFPMSQLGKQPQEAPLSTADADDSAKTPPSAGLLPSVPKFAPARVRVRSSGRLAAG